MKRIELELDEKTLERARRLAQSRRCTVEQLLKEMLEHLGVAETTTDPFLGMLAQEPQIADELIEVGHDGA